MLNKQEIGAMLQIIGRADFKGEEVPGVSVLIQKLQQMAQKEEQSAELKPAKKEAK